MARTEKEVMAKSTYERVKEYRERLKQKPAEYEKAKEKDAKRNRLNRSRQKR